MHLEVVAAGGLSVAVRLNKALNVLLQAAPFRAFRAPMQPSIAIVQVEVSAEH